MYVQLIRLIKTNSYSAKKHCYIFLEYFGNGSWGKLIHLLVIIFLICVFFMKPKHNSWHCRTYSAWRVQRPGNQSTCKPNAIHQNKIIEYSLKSVTTPVIFNYSSQDGGKQRIYLRKWGPKQIEIYRYDNGVL